jgi:hypothetical protein
MNTNRIPGDDDAFRKVLGEWRVDAPLPPRFKEQVWQRIAKADNRSEPAAWAGLWRLIGVVLPRPGIAYAYLAFLLLSGVAAGTWAAQLKSNRMNSELRMRYVQSIDPYLADNSQP